MKRIAAIFLGVSLVASAARANFDTIQLFGMNPAQLAASLADNAKKGNSLVEIEVIQSWGTLSYSAIWRTVGKKIAFTPHFGETVEQFKTLVETAHQQNLGPAQFTATTGGIFASMWLPNDDGRQWYLQTELTPSAYQTYFNRMVALGRRLKHLQAYYAADGQLKFAALFDNAGVGAWESHHAMSAAEFSAYEATFKAKGWNLTFLEAYNDSGAIHYAARWADMGSIPPYVTNLDMTFAELQDNIKQQGAIPGRSLESISEFTEKGLSHFAAIWQ